MQVQHISTHLEPLDVLVGPWHPEFSEPCPKPSCPSQTRYETIAAELIRSLRGKRSQAALSRRLGYKSNIVNRWERREAFPSAVAFLASSPARTRDSPRRSSASFRARRRSSPRSRPISRAAWPSFLRELRGKAPILTIAKELQGYNRYSVGAGWTAASSRGCHSFFT